ncbi:MAG TPA: flagellar hook-basal body complex protein [Candidatus Binatus sp.]|nr:flagellar hook-basal body complex protein [Candidatus Binatus sp.]
MAGASGMAAQQTALDVIATNLSNVDTPGFRADRPEFASLIDDAGRRMGASATRSVRLFSQGKIETTSNDFDLAIRGDGLFQVRTTTGAIAYTRAGNFTPDAAGRLQLPNGASLTRLRLPAGALGCTFAEDGRVRAHVGGSQETREVGRLALYAFTNPAGLRLADDGLLYQTNASGAPIYGRPKSGGFGVLRQRCLEHANIDVMTSMMAVLAAQRAYEANAKSVQAADEMLRLANNLER